MDRRERLDDSVEAFRAAMEGSLAETWTTLPGIVQSYDPDAMTVTVQPAIRGKIERPDGSMVSVDLPLLVDVPVLYQGGGDFVITMPVAKGDECVVVFADRCIDGWWQSGGVADPLESRMHNLSDGFAFVGPYSQPRRIGNVSSTDVQLRTKDGKASVTMQPDYTITATNPEATLTMTPDGDISGVASQRIRLQAPVLDLAANAINMASLDGGKAKAKIVGDIEQDGSHTTTGDQVADGVSQRSHRHKDSQPGNGTTGVPA